MAIETTVFAEEDKTSLIDGGEEWRAKCEELGLKGQVEMVDSGPGGQPNPFRRMDVTLVRIVETLCPAKQTVEDFDKEPIPMAALGAYGLAKQKGYFESVLIHYAPGQADPFMVGIVKGKTTEQFLLAHWGPEKFNLDALFLKAKRAWVETHGAKLRSHLAEWNAKADHLEALATDFFAGGWVHVPS